MKLQRRSTKNINFADTGSLSDLAFLLIIFFIVIAVFNINEGFILSLPKKDSTRTVNVQDLMKVELDSTGAIIYEEKEISAAELSRITSAKISINPNITLMLTIDPETEYQELVSMVNFVRSQQIENFSFKMLGQDEN